MNELRLGKAISQSYALFLFSRGENLFGAKFVNTFLTFHEILISVGPVPTPLISVGYFEGAENEIYQ